MTSHSKASPRIKPSQSSLPTTLSKHYFWQLFWVTFSIAAITVGVLFWWQGSWGFELRDEGFLWYGVQRIFHGEVPIRDFMSYDPGRYYFCAAFMGLLGKENIMTLRVLETIFQFFGVWCGLFLLGKTWFSNFLEKTTKHFQPLSWNSLSYLALSSLILVMWMPVRFKSFDTTVSILLIAALNFLLDKPNLKRHFWSGCVLGLCAFFGRNHGLYGLVGGFGALAWIHWGQSSWKKFLQSFVIWGLGITIGYSPMLFMVLFVPGYGAAFWESILAIFYMKATNLPLPMPYPWLVHLAGNSLSEIAYYIYLTLQGTYTLIIMLISVCFTITLVIVRYIRWKIPTNVIACGLLALPYAHYTYSRPSVYHLALGIFPLLLGILIVISIQKREIKWILFILFFLFNISMTLPIQDGWKYRKPSWHPTKVTISGDTLLIPIWEADEVGMIYQLDKKYAPHGENVLFAPYWPGAYTLLKKRCPIYDIFVTYPRPLYFQKKELENLKKTHPSLIFILNEPQDHCEIFRFSNNRPVLYQYIKKNYQQIANPGTNPDYQVFIDPEKTESFSPIKK